MPYDHEKDQMESSIYGTMEKKINYNSTCMYKNKKCSNPRAIKKDGTFLKICEYHRIQQNDLKRKSDRKLKRLRDIQIIEQKKNSTNNKVVDNPSHRKNGLQIEVHLNNQIISKEVEEILHPPKDINSYISGIDMIYQTSSEVENSYKEIPIQNADDDNSIPIVMSSNTSQWEYYSPLESQQFKIENSNINSFDPNLASFSSYQPAIPVPFDSNQLTGTNIIDAEEAMRMACYFLG